MFAVLIEAEPHREQWDAYFAKADMLRPQLERTPGFVDDARYRSLNRHGWILSLSSWSDQASVDGWHTRMGDHESREAGWGKLVAGYRLRVGEVTSDTRLPQDEEILERPAEDAPVGGITYVTLIDARQTPAWVAATNPQEAALYLGFELYSYGDCISWDLYDSLSSPGEIVLVVTWKDAQSANDHAATQIVPDDARVRVVRVVRDDSISDRPEPEEAGSAAAAGETIRA